MTLKAFIRDNPNRKLILLWFKDDELQTKYVYQDQINYISKHILNMEVMETDTYDKEDWIEVWLR
jgi:hypothetical protein